jgi:hypothetical protein
LRRRPPLVLDQIMRDAQWLHSTAAKSAQLPTSEQFFGFSESETIFTYRPRDIRCSRKPKQFSGILNFGTATFTVHVLFDSKLKPRC